MRNEDESHCDRKKLYSLNLSCFVRKDGLVIRPKDVAKAESERKDKKYAIHKKKKQEIKLRELTDRQDKQMGQMRFREAK